MGYRMSIRNTYDTLGLILTDQVFSHGQLYTALSRVGSMKNLSILLDPNDDKLIKEIFRKLQNTVHF